MNNPMKIGYSCGILFEDKNKNKLEIIKDLINTRGYWQHKIILTNCPRMLTALKLCGYETITKEKVLGIETFACGG